MIPLYPKPGQVKKKPEWIKIYPDGREVLNLNTKAGMDEYMRRKRVAWEEQQKICPLCRLRLLWAEATADHKQPRGMGGGRRDDSQSNIAAVHGLCNSMRGSRRTGYNDEEGG